jgi:hypothetical protein
LLMANAAQSVDVLPNPKPKRVFLIARGPQALAIPALYFSYKIAIAFSLLLYTRQPPRLFLKKTRTSLIPTLRSRSKNALGTCQP